MHFELPGKKPGEEVSEAIPGTNEVCAEKKPEIVVGDTPRARALEALGVCSTKF
jgi:hypothetical protein